MPIKMLTNKKTNMWVSHKEKWIDLNKTKKKCFFLTKMFIFAIAKKKLELLAEKFVAT